MRHETQVSLIERLMPMVDEGATGVGEAETPWPVSAYHSPERYERELRTIARYPALVAHSAQLPNPGDYLLDRTTGRELIVVRGEDGVVRALRNVCRHRGAQLVDRERGVGATSFVCPYHAWTYDTAGNLTHVPDHAQSFPCLDKAQRPLARLEVEERHGLIWVLPDKRQRAGYRDVAEFLGPELDDEFAAYGFDDFVFYKQETWDAAVNWKGAVESFLENYHFAYLHRDSTHPIFVHNVGVCDELNMHFRAMAPKRSLATLKELDRADWDIRPHATILYVVFPFSIFFVEKHHFTLLQIVPTGIDSSLVRATHVVEYDKLSMRPFWNANIGLFMAAIKEDLGICESIQRGVRSGVNEDFLFGRNEVGCTAYRRCLERALAEADEAAAAAAGDGNGATPQHATRHDALTR